MTTELELLNVNVNRITLRELNSAVKEIVFQDRKEIIANHNLHSIYLLNNNSELKEFWEKSYLTHIDGMPLIWWGRLLGYSLKSEHRITYLDWIFPFLSVANENNWKIFYLGGKPGVAKEAVNILSDSYSNVKFKTQGGYFDLQSEENVRIVNKINNFRPNILMVGMGMPRQEKWILQNFEALEANVILNCGACFDYIAGGQKAPPRILGKIGLEWFYRFLNDPKRLFGRYFIEPFSLVPLFVKDFFNHGKS